MKKNTKKIATLLLVAVVAVGSYFVSGTYAKYTSEIAGDDTASVAKWAWNINNDDITSAEDVTNGYTFDLFDTINEADTTTTEDDVHKTSSKVDRIAPGTGGSFDIDITNNSEVNATYAINFTETNANNIPIEYSTDDGSTWSTVSSANVPTTDINMGQSSQTLTVKWRWAFTGAQSSNYTSTQTDTTDTALGFAANTSAPTVQVTATVTVTQKD